MHQESEWTRTKTQTHLQQHYILSVMCPLRAFIVILQVPSFCFLYMRHDQYQRPEVPLSVRARRLEQLTFA